MRWTARPDGLGHRGPGLIGRTADAAYRIEHPSVSRMHALLEQSSDGWWLRDLGSRNGTWIEGRRILRHPLSPGDRIRLGKVACRFMPSPEHGGPDRSRLPWRRPVWQLLPLLPFLGLLLGPLGATCAGLSALFLQRRILQREVFRILHRLELAWNHDCPEEIRGATSHPTLKPIAEAFADVLEARPGDAP